MFGVENKYGILGDFHCHTIASVHAYSTLGENITAAKAKGLKYLAITDHAIACDDSPPLTFFENLVSLPKYVDGVRLLIGVEANIIDYDGHIDMPEEILKNLDIIIASYHTNCMEPGTVEQHTRSYNKLAENPYVKIIGHAGTAAYEFNYEDAVVTLGEAGKVFEINSHTFLCRKKSIENCKRIAKICKEHRFPVLVNSDAHSHFDVASCDKAFEMLKEIDFPDELIINIDEQRIQEFLKSIGA